VERARERCSRACNAKEWSATVLIELTILWRLFAMLLKISAMPW